MAPKKKRSRKPKRRPSPERSGPEKPRGTARSGVGGREERFTETREQFQARLRRERIAGGSVFTVALVVLLLNLVMEFAPEVTLLPGGHSELYFVASTIVAGIAAWITFDLGNNRRVRR